ncbi:MAG: shikimate dehydrogenase [Desulfobacterales bacterium]
MRSPSAHTKLVFLLGSPLGHTLSPVMHNRLFEKIGLDYLYLPVEVSDEDLEVVFAGLIRMNVAGFNVTIPHKVRIMEMLDELDPLARVIGAVNTICVRDGRTKGYNTDGEGFVISLEKGLPGPIDGRRVFILGCGGAARGVAMTLAHRGVSKIFLCNRTATRAEVLADEINTRVKPCAEAVPWDSRRMKASLAGSDVLVNATSVGMHPNEEAMPIDEELLFSRLAVADFVYNPPMTRLLKAARKRGCRIVNGQGMLVYQGALAFKLWTGIEPIVEEMFAALKVLQS